MAKVLFNNAGTATELLTIATTAGAGDADKIPSTNGAGILAPALLNATLTSAGAGDAGKLIQLDASGRIAVAMMPTGIGADTAAIIASEALAAGDLVNVWNNAAAFNCRKADANSAGKEAHGFVLTSVLSGASATVYFEGTNTAVSGLTPGVRYLGIVAGTSQAAAPTGTGKLVQTVGFAVGATALNFNVTAPIVLA